MAWLERSQRCSVLSDRVSEGRAQLVGGHQEELVAQADGALRLAMEPRVVDGDGGPVRHLLRELEIGARVPSRHTRGQAEGP